MKTIFGFLAIVFSVLIFAPKSNMKIEKPIKTPNINRIETYHYIPSQEVLKSKWELENCERKIRANLIYLNSIEQ